MQTAMWLDRLSGHSTPSQSPPPGSRSYSPGPRRPTHLAPNANSQRPIYSPRSSSLSLITNDSTSSLLSISRTPNGPALKQTTTAPPVDVTDPLEVLKRLIGSDASTVPDAPSKSPSPQSPHDELDFGGLSLKELAEVDNADGSDVHVYRLQTVEEYEKEKEKFEELHRSIRACDEVLRNVEINLTSFKNDLGAVSAEIETLQARSLALSVRLENRKTVEKALGPIVEEITISPAVIRKISEGTMDEAWIRALSEVEKRSKALDAKAKEGRKIKGLDNLKPLLGHLINKALERIRDFLVAQIKSLRSPNINAQIIQQQQFVRYKDLYAFLHRHHTQLAEELGKAYINTMRWYYLNQFTRYHKALEKLKLHVLDKNDVLGQDDGTRKTTIMSTSKAVGPPHDAFNLGRRIDVLKNSNRSALASYIAEEDKNTHYLEVPFRNFNLALVDNASAEYSFLTAFFGGALTYSAITRHFDHIFEPSFQLGQTLTKTLVSETVDGLGLLLCVRLNQHFAFELQRRKVPAVDGYINGTNMLLWPRFQVVMDMHCASVQKVSIPSKSALALQSAAPHFLTQRFGQFLQGILTLSTEAGDDEPVSSSLGRLRNEIEGLLGRLSKGITDARKRGRFLYNNYSLILTIIEDVEGKLAGEQKEHFIGLKKAYAEDQ